METDLLLEDPLEWESASRGASDGKQTVVRNAAGALEDPPAVA